MSVENAAGTASWIEMRLFAGTATVVPGVEVQLDPKRPIVHDSRVSVPATRRVKLRAELLFTKPVASTTVRSRATNGAFGETIVTSDSVSLLFDVPSGEPKSEHPLLGSVIHELAVLILATIAVPVSAPAGPAGPGGPGAPV